MIQADLALMHSNCIPRIVWQPDPPLPVFVVPPSQPHSPARLLLLPPPACHRRFSPLHQAWRNRHLPKCEEDSLVFSGWRRAFSIKFTNSDSHLMTIPSSVRYLENLSTVRASRCMSNLSPSNALVRPKIDSIEKENLHIETQITSKTAHSHAKFQSEISHFLTSESWSASSKTYLVSFIKICEFLRENSPCEFDKFAKLEYRFWIPFWSEWRNRWLLCRRSSSWIESPRNRPQWPTSNPHKSPESLVSQKIVLLSWIEKLGRVLVKLKLFPTFLATMRT